MTQPNSQPDPKARATAIANAIRMAIRRSLWSGKPIWVANALGKEDISEDFYDLFNGFYTDEIKQVWEAMLQRGEIYEPRLGMWKLTNDDKEV